MDLLVEGATHRGIVRNRTPFGLFIELIAGQEDGLLRFDSTPYPEIAKLFHEGDAVEVVVTTVDVGREVVRVQLLSDATLYDGFWKRRVDAEKKVAPDSGGIT